MRAGCLRVAMRLGPRDEPQDTAYVGHDVLAFADGMGGPRRRRSGVKVALDTFAVATDED